MPKRTRMSHEQRLKIRKKQKQKRKQLFNDNDDIPLKQMKDTTIEEKVLDFVVAALRSSQGQLDLMSRTFFIGLRRIFVGSDIAKFCKVIKLKKEQNLIHYTQHPLFFEELAESFAGIMSHSTIIYIFGLGLKLATAYLVSHDDGETKPMPNETQPKPKDGVVDLDSVPDDEDTPPKQEILIDAPKWINMLEYMLEELKKDDVINACLTEQKGSVYVLNIHDFALVKGIIVALEALTSKWRENAESVSQVDALSKAVSELENNVSILVHMTRLRKMPIDFKPITRTNPGAQVLATAFRSMLEALKSQ